MGPAGHLYRKSRFRETRSTNEALRSAVLLLDMNRRDEWRKVLDSEVQRWSAMSCDQLDSALRSLQAYTVELDSRCTRSRSKCWRMPINTFTSWWPLMMELFWHPYRL